MVGEKTTATLHAIDADGKEYAQPLVNTSCDLVSDVGGPTFKAAVQKKRKKYTISYQESISYTSKWREYPSEEVRLL